MLAQMQNTRPISRSNIRKPSALRYVPARLEDCDAVVALLGALHAYNASLDSHFALSERLLPFSPVYTGRRGKG